MESNLTIQGKNENEVYLRIPGYQSLYIYIHIYIYI